MLIQLKPITCDNIVLASTTFIPETFSEKAIGLRGKDIVRGVGMIFEVSNSILEMFDTFLCKSIGWIAISKDKEVLKAGVMRPNKIKFIRCAYWLEVHPDIISKITIGSKVEGIC